jgi:striatin 1/3/4
MLSISLVTYVWRDALDEADGNLGIMRFLQMEWHNHERARNAWEIEREELKQKASKDEGQLNKLRRQVEALEKHVKMLEMALKAERAKSKALASGDKSVSEETSPKEPKAKGFGKIEAAGGKAKTKRARNLSF